MSLRAGRRFLPGRATRRVAVHEEQTLADEEQTVADLDQTGSDLDQTSADADQHASDRDQLASDRDQLASDRDQEAADEDATIRSGDHQDDAPYERSRKARSRSTIERDLATQARSETARVRDESAARRDRMADERDAAACARDQLAASLDGEINRLEVDSRGENGGPSPIGLGRLLRAAGDRKRAAASRTQAALHREAAARDREQAAQDRVQAALDRAAAAEELAQEGVDHVTGALRRRVGLAAIQRELDRTHRTDERLVVAFVDVNGLKAVNDTQGHAAGDELLHAVARSIMEHLRSYDVITRYGGDEFVCSLSVQDVAGVHERFEQIADHLADATGGATFSVGFAERQSDDSLDDLISRADAAMIAARKQRPN
jgi:diguanylate cyclase (GGDEF)-like protein